MWMQKQTGFSVLYVLSHVTEQGSVSEAIFFPLNLHFQQDCSHERNSVRAANR